MMNKVTNHNNLKAKIATCIATGVCIALLGTGSALAEEPTLQQVRAEFDGGEVLAHGGKTVASSELSTNHQEIDAYIFEQGGLEQFREAGFTVTHTGPMDDVIEIGITPYEAAYATKLYELFGEDQVVVVEGVQAVTLIGPDTPVSSSASGAEEPTFSTMVVGGPEAGEGEAAITSIEPDVADDHLTSEDGDVLEIVPISAPIDGDEAASAVETAQPISAPADGGNNQAAPVWPWVAAGTAVLAAVALIIRKLASVRK